MIKVLRVTYIRTCVVSYPNYYPNRLLSYIVLAFNTSLLAWHFCIVSNINTRVHLFMHTTGSFIDKLMANTVTVLPTYISLIW